MQLAFQRTIDSGKARADFFVIGAQKAGTTALDRMLRQHPALMMARTKETHFFDRAEKDWAGSDYSDFHQQFDWRRPAVRGEATPIYLYWPDAIERLWTYNSSAKLIVGLRHPVFRAFSHWRMEVSRGAETLDFSSAIREGRQRVRDAAGGVHRIYSYVERGFYGDQLERLFRYFDHDQVCCYRTDELYACPERVLARLWGFLRVEAPARAIGSEYVAPLVNRVSSALCSADRSYLESIYAGQYARVEALSGVDLSDWRHPDYAEPMRAPPQA